MFGEVLSQLLAWGTAMVGLNMAITQKIKNATDKQINSELVSIVVGLVVSPLIFAYVYGVPANVNEILGIVLFTIAGAFAPSGGYELLEEFLPQK